MVFSGTVLSNFPRVFTISEQHFKKRLGSFLVPPGGLEAVPAPREREREREHGHRFTEVSLRRARGCRPLRALLLALLLRARPAALRLALRLLLLAPAGCPLPRGADGERRSRPPDPGRLLPCERLVCCMCYAQHTSMFDLSSLSDSCFLHGKTTFQQSAGSGLPSPASSAIAVGLDALRCQTSGLGSALAGRWRHRRAGRRKAYWYARGRRGSKGTNGENGHRGRDRRQSRTAGEQPTGERAARDRGGGICTM